MSKRLNDQLIDIRSKNHQEYINKFNKRIDFSTEKVCNNIIVNDINSFKSTYRNISEVNKKNESSKEKENMIQLHEKMVPVKLLKIQCYKICHLMIQCHLSLTLI